MKNILSQGVLSMKGYVLDVKDRKWVVLCLENEVRGKTISVITQDYYFRNKRDAIEFAENKCGHYLVYIYKRVKTFVPSFRKVLHDIFIGD